MKNILEKYGIEGINKNGILELSESYSKNAVSVTICCLIHHFIDKYGMHYGIKQLLLLYSDIKYQIKEYHIIELQYSPKDVMIIADGIYFTKVSTVKQFMIKDSIYAMNINEFEELFLEIDGIYVQLANKKEANLKAVVGFIYSVFEFQFPNTLPHLEIERYKVQFNYKGYSLWFFIQSEASTEIILYNEFYKKIISEEIIPMSQLTYENVAKVINSVYKLDREKPIVDEIIFKSNE